MCTFLKQTHIGVCYHRIFLLRVYDSKILKRKHTVDHLGSEKKLWDPY